MRIQLKDIIKPLDQYNREIIRNNNIKLGQIWAAEDAYSKRTIKIIDISEYWISFAIQDKRNSYIKITPVSFIEKYRYVSG